MTEDPRAPDGAFAQLMEDLRACKERRTCPELTIRSLYFEPNPRTAPEWKDRLLFVEPIDRRVMFVCESPGPWPGADESTVPVACWGDSGFRSKRFQAVRERFGFANCYITNSVKCGPRRDGCHTESEIGACLPFLLREVALIAPLVVVGVGANAAWTLERFALPVLKSAPALHRMTHYSVWKWSNERLQATWKQEFGALQRLLSGLSHPNEVRR